MNNNTKRICFNQEIDLKDLEKEYETNTPEFKGWFKDRYKGEFAGFTWVDLSLKNPTDAEFTNADIRDESTLDELFYKYQKFFLQKLHELMDMLPLMLLDFLSEVLLSFEDLQYLRYLLYHN